MRLGRNARLRLASSFILPLAIALAGCGDDAPAQSDGGGGTGGIGDAGPDRGGDRGGGGGTGGVDAGDAGRDGVGGADAGDGGSPDGVGDGSTDAAACFGVTFVSPVHAAMLTVNDDKDGDLCAGGFQVDVRISSTAPAGTTANLFVGNQLVRAATVTGGMATFSDIRLLTGDSTLQIEFPGSVACTDPSTRATVNVSCAVPACAITKPVLSMTHPALNGVLAAQGGDRVSADGSPYQAAFEVTTDVEDGQPVSLLVANAAAPTAVTTIAGTASGGKATFPGVTLVPDGSYQVRAQCVARSGASTTSIVSTFPVDTTAPTLTVSRPTNGQFFGPGDLVNGRFQVCGSTTSADAVGLPASLGPAANNFCLAASATCAPVTGSATDACVDFICNGGAPFDITVALNDAAGNKATATITGVTCASTLPSVQIVAPVSDAPTFNDTSKHLLAATAAQAFRDQQAGTPGAQADVVACADRAGSARLFVGQQGGALAQLGVSVTTAAATAGDNCPGGLGFVARFAGATLPESALAADGTLASATRLRVDVTDLATATGSSPAVDIWVDSSAPLVALRAPANLCGSFHQAATTFVTGIDLDADTDVITLTVTNAGSTDTLQNPLFAGGVATFPTVTFAQGASRVAVVAADRAGNTTAMLPATCTVTVGAPPMVEFRSPAPGDKLCAAGAVAAGCINDAAGTPGWQGSVRVHASLAGAPITTGNITFSVGGVVIGVAGLDGGGNAMLDGLTFFDGTVTITAQSDNILGAGVGTGIITVVVDTGPPDAPPTLNAVVRDRRQTSFRLRWRAPADNGQSVADYKVHYSRTAITDGNFDAVGLTGSVDFTGTPAGPGQNESIDVTGLAIEQDYYFAVAAVDSFGNRGVAISAGPFKAQFLTTVLTGPGADDRIGSDLDGSGDFGTPPAAAGADITSTPDTYSDLLVGAPGGRRAYIYFGGSSGYPATPTITITGAGTNFGQSVVNAGDLDGDTLPDIAVSSPVEGKIYIYSQKAPRPWGGAAGIWPAALNDAEANYVLTVDPAFAGAGASALLQVRGLARLGNFDGMGADDLGISVALHDLPGPVTNVGAALIVRGSAAFATATIPDANTIQIEGTIAGGVLGAGIVGIGPWPFSGSAGTSLLVGAAGASAAYAFRGQSPAGVLTAANADDFVTIAGATDQYGGSVGLLGPLGPSPTPAAVIVRASGPATGKYVDVHVGTTATGPLLGAVGGMPAATVRFTNSQSANAFGVITIGGGIKGTSGSVSFIGNDTIPDLVMAGQSEAGSPVYIVNGARIASFSGSVDVSTARTEVVPPIIKASGYVPETVWGGYAGMTLIQKSNGDAHADFAVGEAATNPPLPLTQRAGRVVVFY